MLLLIAQVHACDGDLNLAAVSRADGAPLTFHGAREDLACVTLAGARVELARSSVALLPARAAEGWYLVGYEGGVPMATEGPYGMPEPREALWLEPTAPADPVVIGDVDLAAMTPTSPTEATLLRPLALRGLTVPEGTTLVWEASTGMLSELVLQEAAELGGLKLAKGTRLVVAQGCDLAVEATCYEVREGRLVAL